MDWEARSGEWGSIAQDLNGDRRLVSREDDSRDEQRCICESERRQNPGQRLRAAPTRSGFSIDDIRPANRNKPITSLRGAAEPVCVSKDCSWECGSHCGAAAAFSGSFPHGAGSLGCRAQPC
jgi:hypothetical protein